MTRYAIIEFNTGYLWGVIDAADPVSACAALDAEIGGRDGGTYAEVGESELRTTRGVYDVRIAPADWDAGLGDDPAVIEAVEEMPRAAVVGWSAAE